MKKKKNWWWGSPPTPLTGAAPLDSACLRIQNSKNFEYKIDHFSKNKNLRNRKIIFFMGFTKKSPGSSKIILGHGRLSKEHFFRKDFPFMILHY